MKKTNISLLLISCLMSSLLMSQNIKAQYVTKPEVTDNFQVIGTKGEVETVSYDNIEPVVQQRKSRSLIHYGVLYLNSKGHEGNSYLTYDNVSNAGYDGYTTGSYAKDAAYIGEYNGKVRGMQAGVIMDFDARDVSIVDYTQADISHYYIKDGYLYHQYYYGASSKGVQRVGYSLSYMKENFKYYSYDGHYFYTDYIKMIDDYRGNTFKQAINTSKPYYNYYQFLSHRSQSRYTGAIFDTIVEDNVGQSESKMKGLGNTFIEYQNTYGANASLMFGVARNESGWGTSSICKDKNNLFGHGAGDNNPYWGAHGYASPADSIKYHAEKFISSGYLDNEDWRYQGGHLGDKASGLNVRYASDPYWGEKAASLSYYYPQNNDYGYYKLGIINGVQKDFKLYKEATYDSPVIHQLGKGRSPRTFNLPVIVLDTVRDNQGNEWYKIQCDTALNSTRTDTSWNSLYSFERDYVYIPSTSLYLVGQEKNNTIYKKGDVNGDDKVNSLDYVQIENHIMDRKVLEGERLLRADVDGNGKINALDYVKIENHIMGRNPLF